MASWAGPAVDGSGLIIRRRALADAGYQHGVHGCRGDADRVQDSHVRKDPSSAECVDGRVGYAEQLGDFADGEQAIAMTLEPRGREQNRSKIFRKRCFWLRSAGDAIAETRMIS